MFKSFDEDCGVLPERNNQSGMRPDPIRNLERFSCRVVQPRRNVDRSPTFISHRNPVPYRAG